MPFTLDVTPPVSQAARCFSIVLTVQWRERTWCIRDSRKARILTNDLQRGIYLELFIRIVEHLKSTDKMKYVTIEADELSMCRWSRLSSNSMSTCRQFPNMPKNIVECYFNNAKSFKR